MGSRSRCSSDSSGSMGGGSGSRSWPSFSGGMAEEAGIGVESEATGSGDPLAAALLPRGKRTQRRHRARLRQQAQGEEAWVVEVRVQEEAYMAVLGGETQVVGLTVLSGA